MPAPSMLVAWEGTKGGNFDGQTIWKHRWGIYYRMGNAAGVAVPVGYEDLWALTCNGPPGGAAGRTSATSDYPGLDIMDTPSIDHALDEDLVDRFKGVFTFPRSETTDGRATDSPRARDRRLGHVAPSADRRRSGSRGHAGEPAAS